MTEQHTNETRMTDHRAPGRRRGWRNAAFALGAVATVAVTLGFSTPAFADEATTQTSVTQTTDAPVTEAVSASTSAESLAALGLLNEQQRADGVADYVDADASSNQVETTALAYNSQFSDNLIELLSV
ncbi:hypothetical protein [Gulosibacter sp. ACHW.36C]|uniref:Uncharacterized protein n=1 Tax=Gulosibacter sediminis TaxID=1729695 RepID=A0ABY4MYI0_9MICO|nr:hypothetical protein [Gulosibacter sediminis]UQN14441.1 hypothetical protein M3M28_10320 [Gulosibacter sediminis]